MVQFHDLAVTDIKKTIRDAVVVTLKPEDADAFDFVQGQYLTFRKKFDGEELRRSYSICAGKDDNILQVGIKRVDGGAFSTWANTELKVGDRLEAMPPMGNFYNLNESPSDPDYLCFAAGSGITPILSILRTGLARDLTARYTLVYANRNVNTIMFREELEDLKNEYLDRLSIIHVLEDDSQDIELFSGRIDADKCAGLFEHWIDLENVDTAYICGPEPMMLTVSDALKANGLNKDQIRFELFASGQQGRAKKRAASADAQTADVSAKITLAGETRSFEMSNDTSLLEAALQNKLDAPFACKSGICSTCKAKVVEGEVEMIANHALEDYEVDAGFVLTCQCYPVSDKVVWDYDQAGG
ncbi:2Fe-2S iron-sulfur cluster-binding protein [Lentilitoribacter sp. Alg239-R112]|uniref:2Fe-2S iron-sulfur cluster-binding protein n=1 Tax=Lentilitoribacter sp. Alg239-R112 TaxID=2305987 RepID=UPI0013A6DE92|nr:2Fe-2S iron-sulfur cluster-binding protein [Lentilitoribacter sp. Alg239-R112]